jgi:hypothetical protein
LREVIEYLKEMESRAWMRKAQERKDWAEIVR